MVVGDGETPEEIRVTREEYDDLTTHLGRLPNDERARELLAKIARWRPEPQVVGQLELPLEWDESGAGR